MFSVSLKDVVEEFSLEVLTCSDQLDNVHINITDVNRPGLPLAGYMIFFDSHRIQIIGKVETTYLSGLSKEQRISILDQFFSLGFPCLIIARGLPVLEEMLSVSCKYNIPILRTPVVTSKFMSGLIRFLSVRLAPRENRNGCFVEVYGEGVLIFGESGVGKSETALELIKRGHRLVADAVVEIRKDPDDSLIGTATDIMRHSITIKGLGVLDVKKLYGVGAIKITQQINLVINLEFWDENRSYDRLGIVDQCIQILDVDVPYLNIPIRPGRNFAIIVEVAAMNNRQKNMGYNAAKTLCQRVLQEMNRQTDSPQ